MRRHISIKMFARNVNKVYIYGTGNWAGIITKYCRDKHIHIDGYLVSDNQEKQDGFRGREVYYLNKAPVKESDGIIIAVYDKRSVDDIKKCIMEANKCSNLYVFIDDIKAIEKWQDKKSILLQKKRAKKSVFEYLSLCNKLTNPWIKKHYWFLYGIHKCIKKYTRGAQKNINDCVIDHGARVLRYFNKDEYRTVLNEHTVFAPGGTVWSDIPGVCLHRTGPYIKYVKPLYTRKQMKKIKEKLGRTLLVFPSHSIESMEISYSVNRFISEIKRIREEKNFETVLICMYYHDINKKKYVPYQENGFVIVTAGHSNDMNHLRRLKSIISMADMTMVNDFGTCMGYCVYMNKPLYAYMMDDSTEWNQLAHLKNHVDINGKEIIDWTDIIEQGRKDIREILNAFSIYKEYIEKEQYEIIKKYWGDWKERSYKC